MKGFKSVINPLLYKMVSAKLWLLLLVAALIIAITVVLVARELNKK